MIKAVFFDMGSTLVEPCPDIDGVFFEVARRRGHGLAQADISVHMDKVNIFYEQEYLRDGDFWCSHEGSVERYLEMYRYLSHLTGIAHDAEGMARQVHAAYETPACWEVIDGAPAALRALKARHMRLGVVSNWSSNLTDLVRGLYLSPYFDEIVSSADVGYRKPNPMIFTLALERMGIEAAEAVHVGDRPDADGEGARAAGIMPVIVDRQGRWDGCGFRRIGGLGELSEVLAAL